MRYFRCTHEFDHDADFYTSSTSDATTAEDIADALSLEHYSVEECSAEEFIRETDEEETANSKFEALKQLDQIRELVSELTTRVHAGSESDIEGELQKIGELLYTLNKKVEYI